MDKRKKTCKDKYEGTSWSSNNFGDFEILEYFNYHKVKIKFITTGYTTHAKMDKIRRGKVKDKLLPSVYGVGYLGDGPYSASLIGKYTKVYYTWRAMLQRCYCSMYQENKPTYEGCTVADEWHNFQNFAKWFEDNYIEGYELDKDLKVEGNKIYSPEACMFVSKQHNTEKANAKHYKVLSPRGEVINIYNMAKFCRDNSLNLSSMYKVLNGKSSHYKGWTKT